MKRVAIFAVVLAGLLAGTAQAAPFNPRLNLAFAIANEYWGGPPTLCTGIDMRMLPESQLRLGLPEEDGEATQPEGIPVPCILYINERLARSPFDFAEACEAVLHEDGHLHGLGHSGDIHSPMYPDVTWQQPICIHAAILLEELALARKHLARALGPQPKREHWIEQASARLWAPLIG